MDGADAQRAELQLEHALLPAQPRGNGAADGQQYGDLGVSEARQRVPEQDERRLVEPLQIVDAEQEPPFPCKPLQRIQEREGDETVVDRAGGFRDSERSVQGAPLRRRKVRVHIAGDAADEVRET